MAEILPDESYLGKVEFAEAAQPSSELSQKFMKSLVDQGYRVYDFKAEEHSDNEMSFEIRDQNSKGEATVKADFEKAVKACKGAKSLGFRS